MTSNVEPIPVRFRHKRIVPAREMYQQPEPSDDMAWAVCMYLRGDDDFWCDHCPRWHEEPDYGKLKKGCRGLAEEACKVAMAVLVRGGATLPASSANDETTLADSR